MNRRLAEHKNRKVSSSAAADWLEEAHPNASVRAAAAAARVAARYAKAPSYSEVLADEARAAVRAAEAASRAAIEAQAAAESVLAGLEAARAAEPVWEVHSSVAEPEGRTEKQGEKAKRETAAPEPAAAEPARDRQEYEIRWERAMPVRPAEPLVAHTMRGAVSQEAEMEPGKAQVWRAQESLEGAPIEVVEPAQPIHANLIEFPREIVATRKVRPRLAEGPLSEASAFGAQLSIFEVDPRAVSTEPMAAGGMDEAAATVWTGPEWSGIELDEQPRREYLDQGRAEALEELNLEEEEAQAGAPVLELAPMSRRLMAVVVNVSLIAGVTLGACVIVAEKLKTTPSLRGVEVGAAVALVVVGALYEMLFHALAEGTPGTKYAQISLSTFDGARPTRGQRLGRLAALALSVLPVGLGLVWALFDEDRLSWHDRLSGTYLRKS